ncbi:MAG: aldo/keto reductase, partial [Erysipelotrichaceae bacterium]|nr:aldo/keto reductase [Erysipelotrichaceae bacterium]
NLVDTAPVYGLGHSEEVVGKAIKGLRDKIILVSKCGITRKKATGFGSNGPVRDSSTDMIIKQAEESLERIGTDYLDVLLIHWPDVNTPFAETVEALDQLKKEGKIRFSGICNFEADQIKEFYELGGLDFAQYHFSLVENKWADILHEYHDKDIATMAYGPLGGGILTGAFRSLPDFAADDMRLNFYPFFKEPMFSKCQELLKVMDGIAEAHQVDVSQVAVNWACNHPDITMALCGVTKIRHARSNVEALNWSLSPEERETLNVAAKQLIY